VSFTRSVERRPRGGGILTLLSVLIGSHPTTIEGTPYLCQTGVWLMTEFGDKWRLTGWLVNN
jgi:hypothetical protein